MFSVFSLTHLLLIHPFSAHWKHYSFLMFSEARERMDWEQMGYYTFVHNHFVHNFSPFLVKFYVSRWASMLILCYSQDIGTIFKAYYLPIQSWFALVFLSLFWISILLDHLNIVTRRNQPPVPPHSLKNSYIPYF